MATRVQDLLTGGLDRLRYEPTPRRLRAELAGQTVLDSTAGMLVWEPGRVVPQYAVPVTDIAADLTEAGPDEGDRHGPGPVPFGPDGRTVLTPGTGFGVHTTEGTPLTVRTGDAERRGAAFRPADPALAHLAVLDFAAFDTWLEEDEAVVSHPRDPFHRVDVRRSSRHVRIELDGQVLAESHPPVDGVRDEPACAPLPPSRGRGHDACSRRARPSRRARTRASRPTGRWSCPTERCPTSSGPTPIRCPTP